MAGRFEAISRIPGSDARGPGRAAVATQGRSGAGRAPPQRSVMTTARAAGQRQPRSLGERLIRGGSWAFLGRALALPVGFLQIMLLARLLVPAELGTYFLAMTLATLAAALAQVGMGRTMVKLVATAMAADRPQAARHAIIVAVATTAIGGSITAVALADGPGHGIAQMLSGAARLQAVVGTIAFLVLAFALIDLFAEICRGLHDLRGASLFGDQLVHRLLLVLALSLVWWSARPIDLAGVLNLALASAGAALMVAAWLLLRKLRALGARGAPWSVATILRHGPPFLMVRLNLWLLASTDLWLLGMFRPVEEVAIYGAASRVALFVGAPLVVANAVLAPTIAALFTRGQSGVLERIVRAAATLSALPAAGLLLILLLLGEPLLRLVFTEAYGAAYPVLVCLALGQWTHVAFGSCAITLTMTGHQRDVMIAGSVASLLTVIGFYLVAGPYGAPGVGAVAGASLALYNCSLALIARWRLGIRTWLTLSPSAFMRVRSELGQLLAR
jgi:O-antigen/teichoic acid export membrane protein